MPTVLARPLSAAEAKKQIKLILEEGEVVFRDPYFSKRMGERSISYMDVMNPLRAGIVEEAEWENGEWRHRVRTPRFTVIVTFVEDLLLATCTCWRNDR